MIGSWHRMARRGAAPAFAAALAVASVPAAAGPNVVVSIKPVHSLVAGVMAGVGEPDLLIEGGQSPHTFSLRPSDARRLAEADLVVWVSGTLEVFLIKPLEALAGSAEVIELIDLPGIERLGARPGGLRETEVAEVGDDHAEESAGHGRGHEHAGDDPHIWLDPANARQIVARLVEALAERDPANAPTYRRNGETTLARLDALDSELSEWLTPVRDTPFIVFHDAYQYLERRYRLKALGAIAVAPGRSPGARRLSEMRARIAATEAACVFSEPQFEPALVETIVDGLAVKTAVLDPLGASLAAGPDAYFELLRDLGEALSSCLLAGR